jgi:hypothetical protein
MKNEGLFMLGYDLLVMGVGIFGMSLIILSMVSQIKFKTRLIIVFILVVILVICGISGLYLIRK